MRLNLLKAIILSITIVGCASESKQEKEDSAVEQFKQIEPASQKLTNKELSIVNRAAYDYISKAELSQAEQMQFGAYLAQSQKQFADLSEAVNGSYRGSFAPVTIAVVRLFDPTANIPRLQSRIYDEQTVAMANYVVENMRERLAEERTNIHAYDVQIGPDKWFSRNGYYGITFGSVTPWNLERCNQYRCTRPSLADGQMHREINQIKGHMAELNPEKIEAIHYWADHGNWEEIAENYMAEKKTPLSERLKVRATLITALSDSKAAAFDSKYTYWVKRPDQVDPSIKTVIPAPNHPSYPSGHSTIGKTAAVVLGYFFPENGRQWDSLATESGLSRIWAGIHYPMDHYEGVKLGDKVGRDAIKHQSN